MMTSSPTYAASVTSAEQTVRRRRLVSSAARVPTSTSARIRKHEALLVPREAIVGQAVPGWQVRGDIIIPPRFTTSTDRGTAAGRGAWRSTPP
jgi:hypothetical protein